MNKKGLGFMIMWLVLYLIIINIAVILSSEVGIDNLFTAVFGCLCVAAMLWYLKRNHLLAYYGLIPVNQINYRKLLYGIPFIIYASSNLWFGIYIKDTPQQIALISISMLCVGFMEEMIFRAFLIKALLHRGELFAIMASALLFGGLHMLNAFAGANIFHTFLQVLNTTSFALMCAAFYCRTNHIMPCIICHSLYNVFDTFMPNHLSAAMIMAEGIVVVVSLVYAVYLLKQLPSNKAVHFMNE